MQNETNSPAEFNRESVMAPFQEGKVEAFRWIYERLRVSVFFFTISMVRKEAVANEIMVTIFYKLFSNREGIQTYDDFQKRVYRSARDHSFDYLRGKWYNRLRRFLGLRVPLDAVKEPRKVDELVNLQYILEEIEKVPGPRREWVRTYLLESEDVKEMLRGLRINIR